MQASRYKIQELIDTQGAVSTYQALDTLSNEPVLYYQYLAEPINNAVQILSDNIPNILNMHYTSGMTHVVTVFPAKKERVIKRLDDSQLEQFLLDTSQALEDASDAGVVHGDIRPERLFYDGSRYLIEGYGVRWELLPSRYSAPEKKQSVSGDVYSWAKTIGAFIPKVFPKTLAELLQRCLAKDPKVRPLPEDIVDAIQSYFLGVSQSPKHPTLINLKQTIADAQPDLLDNLFAKGQTGILTNTQERFIEPLDNPDTGANLQSIEEHKEQSLEDITQSADKTVVEASVAVEGSDDSVKLSSADLASSNLQDVSELRNSRSDVSGAVSTEKINSLPNVSSSARVTNASLTNQSISNENALMGSLERTVHKTQHTKSTPTTELDTIDQSLAIIADADTVAAEDDPFLIADDFSDLATRVETPNAEVEKTDMTTAQISDVENPDLEVSDIETVELSDLEVPDSELPDSELPDSELSNPELSNPELSNPELSNTEVLLADNFATQERTVDFVDAEITGLDAIEHKATFHDVKTTQVDIIPINSKQALDDLDTGFDVSEDVEKNISQTDTEKDIAASNTSQLTPEIEAADLEAEAIQSFFPDIVEKKTTAGFTVDDLDFSGDGFSKTSDLAEADTSSKDSQSKNKKESHNIVSTDGFDETVFDATVFDETAFDTKRTPSGTEADQRVEASINEEVAFEDKTDASLETVDLQVDDSPIPDVKVSEEHLDAPVLNIQASDSQASDSSAPTSFSVDELDFGAFGESKSLTSDPDKDEEKVHLDALRAVIDESQPTINLEADSVTQTSLEDEEEFNTADLPNSTQLERAFAALSMPAEGELATEFPSEIVADDDFSTHVPLELDSELDNELDSELNNELDDKLDSELELNSELDDLVELADEEAETIESKESLTSEMPIEIADEAHEVETEFSSKSSEDILKSTSCLIEAEEIFDNLPPSKETIDFSELGIATTETQSDLLVQTSSEEGISLLDTDFSENEIASEVNDFSSIVSEEVDDQIAVKQSEDTLRSLAKEEEAPLVSTPEHDDEQSYASFVDDMDDAAHAYTAQATNKQNIDELKATQEILALIDEEETEPSKVSSDKTSTHIDELGSSDSDTEAAVTEAAITEAAIDLQDDLDDFLGDVLHNEHNSILANKEGLDVDTSNGSPQETLFPIFLGKETVFTNETVQLEPNNSLTTQVANETGIFAAHTHYDQSIDSIQTGVSNAIEIDDEDDLQVIELTDFGSEVNTSESIQVPEIKSIEPAESDNTVDAKAARKARRAERRAAAAAEAEEIDVFKTAFGKIAQMQASVQPESQGLSNNSDDEVGQSFTTPTVIDETKLTVFEAKHLSIAEKIAAKNAKTQAELEIRQTKFEEPLKKTVVGRGSRKVDQEVFGEDNYDAIGKAPSASQDSTIVEPKLTFFEMPPSDDDVADEITEVKQASTKRKKKERKGFFKGKKKSAATITEEFKTVVDENPDISFLTDPESTNFTITSERQIEFNQALAENPIRKAWRIGAASLVLLGAGAIVYMALPELLNAQANNVEQSVTREAQSLPGLAGDYLVYTQVIPANLDMITVEVIKSPEDSKYPVGYQFNIFANSPLSLDVKGEWELQGKYQNRILSNTVPFELPKLGGEPIVFSFNF